MPARSRLAALTAVLAVAVAGCGGAAAGRGAAGHRSATVDVIPPEPVVQAVFDAAKTGDTSRLADLCDPTGNNDQDTEDLCALAEDDSGLEAFRRDFATGAITNTEVTGRRATINFTFGPDGTKIGKLTLVQRNAKWYLAGY